MICKIYTLRLNENEGCIIIENEAGEMLASSGCEEGIPTLSTQFCQAWIENPLPEVEIWESDVADISNAYTQEFGYLFPAEIESYYSKLSLEEAYGNKLPSPSEIGFTSKLNPNTPANWIENALQEEIPILHSEYEKDFLDNLEKEARQNMKKHKLVKRKDLPKRVDFEMLVNSSSLIWNAGHLLGISEDPNNPTVIEGQEAVKNFLLFLQLMKNPKFATKASIEIEKFLSHGKN